MKARGKLRSRSHFYLGRFHDTSRIYLRKTFSNIFVTLTDLFNRTSFVGHQVILVLRALNEENVFHML